MNFTTFRQRPILQPTIYTLNIKQNQAMVAQSCLPCYGISIQELHVTNSLFQNNVYAIPRRVIMRIIKILFSLRYK